MGQRGRPSGDGDRPSIRPFDVHLALLDGAVQRVFSGWPVRRYVIRSFADENGNGNANKLGTNILGMPTERYGCANIARGRMGQGQAG